MTIRSRFSGWFCLLGIAAMASACAKDDPIDRARAMVDAVIDDLESPSGRVDGDSAVEVFESAKSQQSANAAMAFVPGGAPMPSAVFRATQVPGQQCIDGKDPTYTLDMECISMGEVSGSLVYTVEADGGTSIIHMTYDDVCVVDSDTCIAGTAAMQAETGSDGSNFTTAGEFTVTVDGESFDLKYGYRMAISRSGEIEIEYLVYVGDDSYVLTATLGQDTGEFTIRGANGSFTCTYTDGGASGSCEGDGEFEWG